MRWPGWLHRGRHRGRTLVAVPLAGSVPVPTSFQPQAFQPHVVPAQTVDPAGEPARLAPDVDPSVELFFRDGTRVRLSDAEAASFRRIAETLARG
jgi:hypothetical protein